MDVELISHEMMAKDHCRIAPTELSSLNTRQEDLSNQFTKNSMNNQQQPKTNIDKAPVSKAKKEPKS